MTFARFSRMQTGERAPFTFPLQEREKRGTLSCQELNELNESMKSNSEAT